MRLLPRPARGVLRGGGRLHRRRAAPRGRARSCSQVVFAGMAGKLTKLAAGVLMTHYTRSKVSTWPCSQTSPEPPAAPRTWPNRSANANTARHAAELWDEAGLLAAAGRELCARAARVLSRFSAEAGRPRGQRPHRSIQRHHGRLHRPDEDRRGRGVNEQGMTSGGMSAEVTVIGCDGRPFGPEAAAALAAAALVVGAPRHLDAGRVPDRRGTRGAQAPRRRPRRHRRARPPARSPCWPPATRASSASSARCAPAASGRTSSRPSPRSRSPSPGWAWTGTTPWCVSAHGRDPRQALAAALAHPKAAILTAPGTAPRLAQELLAAGKTGLRRRTPRHPAGAGQRPGRRTTTRIRRAQRPHRGRPGRRAERRRAGWPATRAPRTAGRCPRTRSSTATR